MSETMFRPVLGYEGIYEASADGFIRRCDQLGLSRPKQKLKPQINKHGYRFVVLSKGGIKKTYFIHVLVAGAFWGRKPLGYEIDHLDCDKANNRLDNLEYVTKRENLRRQLVNGGFHRGENNRSSKLKEWEVQQIRMLVADGMVQDKVAILFDISQCMVNKIVHRKAWSHV